MFRRSKKHTLSLNEQALRILGHAHSGIQDHITASAKVMHRAIGNCPADLPEQIRKHSEFMHTLARGAAALKLAMEPNFEPGHFPRKTGAPHYLISEDLLHQEISKLIGDKDGKERLCFVTGVELADTVILTQVFSLPLTEQSTVGVTAHPGHFAALLNRLQSRGHQLAANLQPTFLSIRAFLDIPNYREKVIKCIQDPAVAHFFHNEWPIYASWRNDEALAPIRNKIGKITANPYVRNVLAPFKPTFQIREAIPKRSILIVRLSKSILGQRPAGMIGSLVVSSLLKAAQEQEVLPDQSDRIPHYLFIDELRHLTSDVLADAFAEHRHYNFGIVASTQFTKQIRKVDEALLDTMYSNIATILAFRSSNYDADQFEQQVGQFPAHQYTNLDRGEVRGRVLTSEQVVLPVRGRTEIDHISRHGHAKQIRALVRDTYTRPREEIEDECARWLKKELIDPAEKKAQRKEFVERRAYRNGYKVIVPKDPRGTVKFVPVKPNGKPPDRHAPLKKPNRRKNRSQKTKQK